MRIADYKDYLQSLSDKGLIQELESLNEGVDKIKCWLEVTRRNLTIPRKTWKYERSTEEHDHDYDLQNDIHQAELDSHRYEESVIKVFTE
jgi:hypothetical protein